MRRIIRVVNVAAIASLGAGVAAHASSIICSEQVANGQNDRILYQFTQLSGEGLFDAEASGVNGAPVSIVIGTSNSDFDTIGAQFDLENASSWEGLGTKLPGVVRVRVPDDKNKTYQISLENMTATVVQGYRPVAQLNCKVLTTN